MINKFNLQKRMHGNMYYTCSISFKTCSNFHKQKRTIIGQLI